MPEEISTAPKIVMLGGGTGSFTLLRVLKNYVNDITAIVNMADDGGSTGMLRDELGVLPPGDIRQCLVALSQASTEMRELFTYRFPEGRLEGHSFGNLFLTAVEKMTDDMGEAIKLASAVLNVQGQVVPVTHDKITLVMKDGERVIRGENRIREEPFDGNQKPQFSLEPKAKITPDAKTAILNADIIVIAPGHLHGSLIPTFLVEGMEEALQDSKAKIVQVTNLVTKPGQTDGFKVSDFVATMNEYVGGRKIDYVLYNNQRPPQGIMERYGKAGELIVEYDEEKLKNAPYKAIGDDFLSKAFYDVPEGDPLADQRTLIRHDGDKVARQIMKIYFS